MHSEERPPRQVDPPRQQMVCPVCTSPAPAGAQFCSQCGSSISRGHDVTAHEGQVVSRPFVPEMDTISVAERRMKECRSDQAALPSHTAVGPAEPIGHEIDEHSQHAPGSRQVADRGCFCPDCGSRIDKEAEPRLVLAGQGDHGAVVKVSGDPVTIGSDETCDVRLPDDPYVSRRHARVQVVDGLVFLEDLSSSNGTALRVRRSIVVEPGDEILVGKSILRLEQRAR